MQSILNTLIDLFKDATLKAFPQLDSSLSIEVLPSSSDRFGHYQFNSAMKIAKIVQKNPREVADSILKNLDPSPLIYKTDVAGPGFINITLNPMVLSRFLTQISSDPRLGIAKPANPLRIVVDFSSPNTAKEMHVGHLRSTIIGDSLARLFEFMGHDVLRLNHVGDWGTSFGMLITYMKTEAPEVLIGKQPTDLSHLVSWYKASKKKFDEDPEFKKAAQREVVALQSGEPKALEAWNIICEISRKAYQEIYDLLDIRIQERGESFYNPLLADTVKDLESKGLVQISDGAKCIFLEGFQNREGDPLPLMIQKSDGGYNYDTTDMAAIRHRIQDEKANRIVIVTDAGQSTHFQMIFKAAEKAGYLDPKKVRTDHVPFGLVLGTDGKKFRTRAGDTERLIDLLTAAIDHAQKIMDERSPDMDPAERKKIAHELGIGAIKYADLSGNRTGDYVFSYDRMLRFEGNTAAFLMYSYVRVAGIKRKINVDLATLKNEKILLEHPSEVALGLHLLQFGEALELVDKDLLPNRLTEYLYNLAEKFNAFYRDCTVEGSAQQNSRLLLSELTAKIMKQGLNILGVNTVDKM